MPHFLHRTTSSTSHRSLSGFISSTISRTSSPDIKAPILSSLEKIEEELNPKYSPSVFYPAKLGQRVNDGRYEIVAKLGYGMTATVWLAKDLHASAGKGARRYVTIKINMNTMSNNYLQGRKEIAQKLMVTNDKHVGYSHVRFMLETFTIKAKHGDHLCIVYDVLREPIDECQKRLNKGYFSHTALRQLIPALLKGLDYMHTECHVVHTDLKPDNIMMGLGEDPNAVLDRFVAYQQQHPTARKQPDPHNHNLLIYKSSCDLMLIGKSEKSHTFSDEALASAKITDIGLAEWGDRGPNTKPIQTNAFTCPEVLLQNGWTYPADIWNFGVMLWDLIGSQGLFDQIEFVGGKYKPDQHLALMINLLGPPPKDMLEHSLKREHYFDYNKETDEYVFKFPKLLAKFSSFSFESSIEHMSGCTRHLFIDFAKKMIAWRPEDRWTASQLLLHPFLKSSPGSVTDLPQKFEEAHPLIIEGAKVDAENERSRASATPSVASSSQYTDEDYFGKGGFETPPRQGISKRSTNTSLNSMDCMKHTLPSLLSKQVSPENSPLK